MTTATRSVRYMPREEVRAMLATERYLGALYDSNSGHLHPLNYTLGLAAAAEALGVQIFEGTRAVSFAAVGRLDGAHPTAAGEVRARHLVLCGNVYLGATAPALAAQDHGGRHLHRRHRAARRGTGARADQPTMPPSAT